MPFTALRAPAALDYDNRQSSIIDQAVMSGDAEYALELLTRALRLTPDPATADMLDAGAFRRGPDARRLTMIADFLRAECFAAIERGERMVQVRDPMDTVRTRD